MEAITFGTNRKALHFSNQKINLHEQGKEFTPAASSATLGSADLCFIANHHISEVISPLRNCGVEIINGLGTRTDATGPTTSVYCRAPDAR